MPSDRKISPKAQKLIDLSYRIEARLKLNPNPPPRVGIMPMDKIYKPPPRKPTQG